MGGLFSKPKAPEPDPRQEERLQRQEARAEAEERGAARRVQSRMMARRGGGSRMLMAPGVFGQEGVRDVLQRSLGAGRNPRG